MENYQADSILCDFGIDSEVAPEARKEQFVQMLLDPVSHFGRILLIGRSSKKDSKLSGLLDFGSDISTIQNHGLAGLLESSQILDRLPKLAGSVEFLTAARNAIWSETTVELAIPQEPLVELSDAKLEWAAGAYTQDELNQIQQFRERSLRHARANAMRCSKFDEDDVASEATMVANDQVVKGKYTWETNLKMVPDYTKQAFIKLLREFCGSRREVHKGDANAQSMFGPDGQVIFDPMERIANDPGFQTDIRDLIDKALECLDETERNVVCLRHVEGLTFPEIGEALGLSTSQARRIYMTAIEKLRNYFLGRGM